MPGSFVVPTRCAGRDAEIALRVASAHPDPIPTAISPPPPPPPPPPGRPRTGREPRGGPPRASRPADRSRHTTHVPPTGRNPSRASPRANDSRPLAGRERGPAPTHPAEIALRVALALPYPTPTAISPPPPPPPGRPRTGRAHRPVTTHHPRPAHRTQLGGGGAPSRRPATTRRASAGCCDRSRPRTHARTHRTARSPCDDDRVADQGPREWSLGDSNS